MCRGGNFTVVIDMHDWLKFTLRNHTLPTASSSSGELTKFKTP